MRDHLPLRVCTASGGLGASSSRPLTLKRAGRGDRVGQASHGTSGPGAGGSGFPGAEDGGGDYVEEGEGEVENLLDCGDWHGQRPCTVNLQEWQKTRGRGNAQWTLATNRTTTILLVTHT
jgi:hypothetical protein